MRQVVKHQLRRFCAKAEQAGYGSNYYENLISGAITRNHYEAFNNRSDAELGSLGRLYLYQYHVCPYSGKVRTFLDYYQIPYTLIEVQPLSKTGLPDRRAFFHKKQVPVLMCNPATANLWGKAKVLYDSNKIIATLLSHFVAMGKVLPGDYERATTPLVQAWGEWIDEKLIPHLFAAVSHHEDEQVRFFEYLGEFPKFLKAGLGKTVLPYTCVGVFQNQILQIREAHGIRDGEEFEKLKDVLSEWHEITEESFHGGAMPDLADIMCYGALKNFKRCTFFKTILADAGIKEWYDATEFIMPPESSCVTHF